MVKRLYEIKEKYGIGVLDLWNDASFNQIPDDLRALYMHDDIHPTKAGYRDWWGPELEKQLLAFLSTK
jgi:lysophospholipase L1-like esterase